jgi:folylpolyglutamate synthase/dihydropteroate synthase
MLKDKDIAGRAARSRAAHHALASAQLPGPRERRQRSHAEFRQNENNATRDQHASVAELALAAAKKKRREMIRSSCSAPS